jgi:hypothetical protein
MYIIPKNIDKQIGQQRNGFITDLVNAALSEINWYEIAKHYEDDLAKTCSSCGDDDDLEETTNDDDEQAMLCASCRADLSTDDDSET